DRDEERSGRRAREVMPDAMRAEVMISASAGSSRMLRILHTFTLQRNNPRNGRLPHENAPDFRPGRSCLLCAITQRRYGGGSSAGTTDTRTRMRLPGS